jgi:hypothetical protein
MYSKQWIHYWMWLVSQNTAIRERTRCVFAGLGQLENRIPLDTIRFCERMRYPAP